MSRLLPYKEKKKKKVIAACPHENDTILVDRGLGGDFNL